MNFRKGLFMKKTYLIFFLILAFIPVSWADVTPARIFSDNMVLQREMPLPVWGQATPGEKITVEFAGQKVQTTADKEGKWNLKLQPLKASAKPQMMTISGDKTETQIKISNVLVGEVWVCAGQSNMEFQLYKAAQAEDELAAADQPLIREFNILK